MPTEDEIIQPAVHLESTLSRASFSSCPPEEREAHASREVRADGPLPEAAEALSAPAEHTSQPAVAASPELDGQQSVQHVRQVEGRREQQEEAAVIADSPSSVGSPEAASDSDTRLAQSLASTGLRTTNDEAPACLSYPLRSRQMQLPHSTSSFLHPGSKFRGTQQSDRQVYEVQVEIKDVDLSESSLCGYLRIQGLTDDHPTLTTFFEGEIIGPKYLFKTEHPSWNSSEKIDLQHWARFPAWRPLAKAAKNSSTFTLKNYLEREHLFMRWKEYFLVPDHRVKSISGASFEGFYYICFDQRVGSVSGIYFHAKSEKYQQLELKHVPSGGCMGAVEFR